VGLGSYLAQLTSIDDIHIPQPRVNAVPVSREWKGVERCAPLPVRWVCYSSRLMSTRAWARVQHLSRWTVTRRSQESLLDHACVLRTAHAIRRDNPLAIFPDGCTSNRLVYIAFGPLKKGPTNFFSIQPSSLRASFRARKMQSRHATFSS